MFVVCFYIFQAVGGRKTVKSNHIQTKIAMFERLLLEGASEDYGWIGERMENEKTAADRISERKDRTLKHQMRSPTAETIQLQNRKRTRTANERYKEIFNHFFILIKFPQLFHLS
jgi:hypothetical protein